MSDLKWKSVEELEELKGSTEKYIATLKSKLNGQNVRLEWINKYIYEKSPVELSINEIEMRLGHKVIIK